MPQNERTTVRLFDEQPAMLDVLKNKFNTNSASVMRMALVRLYEEETVRRSEPSFVVEVHQLLSSWLGDYGFSHNLGSSLGNVTPEIGGMPLKYTFRRGDGE